MICDLLPDSEAEKVVFEAYAGRYKASYDIPALIPQVYLHYDPYDQRIPSAEVVGRGPLGQPGRDVDLAVGEGVEAAGAQQFDGRVDGSGLGLGHPITVFVVSPRGYLHAVLSLRLQ